jgi:hypothetical protein
MKMMSYGSIQTIETKSPEARTQAARRIARYGGRDVVVVGSDQYLLDTTRQALEESEHTVVECLLGADGLSAVLSRSKKPVEVVVEVEMSTLGMVAVGPRVLDEVDLQHPPGLLMAALDDICDFEIERLRNAGYDEVLSSDCLDPYQVIQDLPLAVEAVGYEVHLRREADRFTALRQRDEAPQLVLAAAG